MSRMLVVGRGRVSSTVDHRAMASMLRLRVVVVSGMPALLLRRSRRRRMRVVPGVVVHASEYRERGELRLPARGSGDAPSWRRIGAAKRGVRQDNLRHTRDEQCDDSEAADHTRAVCPAR